MTFSFLWYCTLLLFAASIRDISIASHNLHSFKQSVAYHKACLKRHGGIWFGQELWLSEKQLSSLQELETQFVARSGMEQSVSDGILVGRPFGGVSIAWSPDLDHCITPLTNSNHKRIVGVELKTSDKDVLLFSIYMPYLNHSRRAECVAETIDAISMLDTLIDQYPNHLVIIGGDLNTEMKGHSPFDPLWADFLTKNQLTACMSQFPPHSITYHHKSLDQKKWIDHFLVSPSLLNSSLSMFRILDEGDNLSDHFPIMMNMKIEIGPGMNTASNSRSTPTLQWQNLSSSHINAYTDAVHHRMHELPPSFCATQCQSTCSCRDKACLESLQIEYDNIINCLRAADASLPRQKPGVKKDWWTSGLDELKSKSIDIHNTWISSGRPRQGPIHDERLRVRAAYKSALRAAQRAPKQAVWERLHTELLQNDTTSFWKSWRHLYNKNKGEFSPVIDGVSSKNGIAETFKACFSKNSSPNNPEKVASLNRTFETDYCYYSAHHLLSCNCKKTEISVINVIDALLCMKGGKSADADCISVEHLHNAPLIMLERIASLFNMMLSHAFVPRQFQLGFMLPLIKDQQGNKSDSSNYRGITISPIISKIFEHVLKARYADYLTTSEFQFGFKKNNSTVHALHCLRMTVDYYINNESRVFCTFLDASKAFDRLVHSGLFIKLMKRNIPIKFLNVIITWYSDLMCRVKWDDAFSEWFPITAGVRQGGILSPDLYSIYVDELLSILRNSGKGCHYLGKFAAALFYADDMAVLSPSIRGLSALLHLCEAYCLEWDICLNAKKSKCLYFGKRIGIDYPIVLNGKAIEWVDQWVYLGVTLRSAKTFDCSIRERVRKFYRSANAILRIEGKSSDTVMLNLIETHCVPILTYAIEIVHVSDRDERRQLRVAYNSVFRRIFGYRWSESVSALQNFLGRPTWEQLVEKRQKNFIERIKKSDPSTLSHLYAI